MSTVIERIELLLSSSAQGAIAGLKETEAASTSLDKSTGKLGTAFDKLGISGSTALKVGVAGAAVAAGAAIGKLALDSVQKFSDLTATVRGFQRVTGGTAEDASRLAAATQRMGIDSQTAQTAFGQLTKRIGEGKDTLAQWGVEIVRNKDGSVNFSATLGNISDKYASLTDATQRQAFATENFGKGAQSINALLGQGKTNLQQFYDVADKHHQIFSQDDLQKGLDFSRAMKDLQTAAQGLEIEVGGMLIPALTGAAHFGTALVEVLDEIAGSSDGAKIAAVAFATALGAAFGGPVGAAIGFATSLAGVLSQSGDSAVDTASKIDKVTAALQGLDAQQALKAFNDLTKAELDASHAHEGFARGFFNTFAGPFADDAKMYESNLTTLSAKFAAFRDLATKDPIGANLLIQQLKAAGVSTKIYENELAIILEKQKKHKDATDAASASNDGLVASQDKSTGSIAAGAKTIADYVKALDDQKKALDAVQSALLAQQGGEIGRQQAVINSTQAQNAYNDAVNQYGADSPQAVSASLALQQARLDEVSATDKARQATDDLGVSLKDPTAVQQRIDQLQDEINKYGDADGALQTQIDKLHFFQVMAANTPPTIAPQFSTPGLDEANYKLANFLSMLATVADAGVLAPGQGLFDPTANPPARASGGPVSAGSLYRVNELGMEYFRPSTSGAIIPLGGGGAATGGIDKSVSIGHMTVVSPNPLSTPRRIVQAVRDEQWKNALL